MSAKLAMSGVSWVLSWHVLSEGQVHYQCGHTSLECVECRVSWTGTSCPQVGSCTSHRSVTRCSSSCSADEDRPGKCSPLCWPSSGLEDSSTPSLGAQQSDSHQKDNVVKLDILFLWNIDQLIVKELLRPGKGTYGEWRPPAHRSLINHWPASARWGICTPTSHRYTADYTGVVYNR